MNDSQTWSKGDVLVGRYELRDVVGAGAGGRIWLALDRNLGGRNTALKFYEPDTLVADLAEHVRAGTLKRDIYEAELKNILNRFRQEAIRVSRLDHPAIVKIYDYQDKEYSAFRGEYEMIRSDPFLAMEFVKGRTLEELLTKGAVGTSEALQIGSQVADGLAYAHAQNLLHRDLKPSNIMVEEAIGGLRVRIIDWGVAKVVADEAQANMTRLIATSEAHSDNIHTRGILLGTPKFIAPEHFKAGGAKWGPASDVFALGMMLFRMVTKRPVRRESFIGECLTQSDRDLLKSACIKVPELEQIVLLCLSEIREERLSAAAVRDALDKIHDRVDGPAGTAGSEPEPTQMMTIAPLAEKMPSTEVSTVPDKDEPSRPAPAQESGELEEIVVRRGPSWAAAVFLLVAGLGGGVAGGYVLKPDAQGAAVSSSITTGNTGNTGNTGTPGTQGAVATTGLGAQTTPLLGGADAGATAQTEGDAKAAGPAPVAEPDFDPIKVRVTSDPIAQAEIRDGDGYKVFNKTPFELVLRHPYEMREIRLTAEQFLELNEKLYALDLQKAEPNADGERVVHLTLHPNIKDITDEKQNPYLNKFNHSFDKELPGP